MDLSLNVQGDLEVDEHHTIEDTAIVLGEAFAEALSDKLGIERYGFACQWTIVSLSSHRFWRTKLVGVGN